ncbi:MAG: hypothetical protein AAGF25_13730 [Pseudomonadota bacterium]
MPSLFRFLFMIGVLVGLAYGAMYALVLYVEPTEREMTERVPTDKINPVRKPLPTPVPEPETAGETNDQ